MLYVNSLSKSYEMKSILKEVSFSILPGERAALLGPNGCGKTTLIRILQGQERADSGSFQFTPPDLKVFFLPQQKYFAPGTTLADVLETGTDSLGDAASQLEILAEKLALQPDDPELMHAFDQALHRIDKAPLDPDQVRDALRETGLDVFPMDFPVSQLSGGQKTRLLLAKMLLNEPDFLILDEPTNDLDEEMLTWLETQLTAFKGGVLYVSHDRAFLNHTATKLLEVDHNTHEMKISIGNYEDWLKLREMEEAAALRNWNRQRQQIRELRKAITRTRENADFRKGGKADSGDKLAKAFFANRSKGTMKNAVLLEARLEKLIEEQTDKPGRFWKMKMEFPFIKESGEQVLILEEADIGYPGRVLLEAVDVRLTRGHICVLVGPNGSGKTTLLRTIIGGLPPLAGIVRTGANVKTGFLSQGMDSPLFKENALETVRSLSGMNETEMRRFLSYYLFFGDEVFVPVEKLSNGQRARLTLACFTLTGTNFLILDEPLNHLDIESREQFEKVLQNFPGTALLVVHDRYFVERCSTLIWQITDRKLCEIQIRS